jgi:hypothetical protein
VPSVRIQSPRSSAAAGIAGISRVGTRQPSAGEAAPGGSARNDAEPTISRNSNHCTRAQHTTSRVGIDTAVPVHYPAVHGRVPGSGVQAAGYGGCILRRRTPDPGRLILESDNDREHMADTGIARARYQGLSAVKPLDPRAGPPARRFQPRRRRPRRRADHHRPPGRGRTTELYQVWSNEHWCALTGKLVAPDALVADGVAPPRSGARSASQACTTPTSSSSSAAARPKGRPYLLLEYLAGPSLFDVLEALPKRRLHVPDAIRATMHVGAAVHYLHRRGYLYRDLKPANILLRAGIPILVDFDVVRKIDPHRRPADRLGTAPYMAPEQILREPLTAATDVYGLGALLYELLTGHWPTDEPDEEDEFWDEAAIRRRRPGSTSPANGRAPSLSTDELRGPLPAAHLSPVPPRQHNPRIDPELERIVLRCLDPDAGHRFQTSPGCSPRSRRCSRAGTASGRRAPRSSGGRTPVALSGADGCLE